jgi:hypothetical protein
MDRNTANRVFYPIAFLWSFSPFSPPKLPEQLSFFKQFLRETDQGSLQRSKRRIKIADCLRGANNFAHS